MSTHPSVISWLIALVVLGEASVRAGALRMSASVVDILLNMSYTVCTISGVRSVLRFAKLIWELYVA